MAKKVTDKDTKQTTKATNENIMNSDQMKEHLDNLVDIAKKNDNTLLTQKSSTILLESRILSLIQI